MAEQRETERKFPPTTPYKERERESDDASSSSSSSKNFSLPLSFENSGADDVLAELNAIGFDKPLEFLSKFSVERVSQAIALVKSKPSGQLKNPAGFIRYLVKSPGAISSINQQDNKREYIFRTGG